MQTEGLTTQLLYHLMEQGTSDGKTAFPFLVTSPFTASTELYATGPDKFLTKQI